LWTALALAEAGVEVMIIDREIRTTARSYACALHPHTLELLAKRGLAETVLKLGRRVETVAFYEGERRCAEVRLSELGGQFPFLLILPQSAFERALEERLRQAGVKVRWHHRFDSLEQEDDAVAATVEELTGTSTGYSVPHWELVVKDRSVVRAQFLVGTDGANSAVRKALGIDFERASKPDSFAAYEFEPEQEAADEVRVVLAPDSTNVLWPLPGGKNRWTFQIQKAEAPAEFPEKERRGVRVVRPAVDERIRQYVEKVAQQRAPWFKSNVKEIAWCTEVSFEPRMVKAFGNKRCWLAGDAAHQAGPVGVQSMNVGFVEAERLAKVLKQVLHAGASMELMAGYNQEATAEWRRLLGISGGWTARDNSEAWAREHLSRIVPCLPASGKELSRLAGQLRLDLE